ncbi:efflux RND transporter periplasmic adaptor subunit [Rugosibacter aromaticivorans]|nr:efflux RND transporter periplasmic adaptor subunit [Rugosibacter aromaticivorans]TBR15024.1 MAG: efflux RND transporter periplasmic adaptor subunit [Rugosibacter sp.]
MRITQVSTTTILLFSLLSGLTGCGPKPGNGAPPSAGGPGGGMPPAEVEFITLAPGSATLTQDLPGRLEAWRTAQVRARVEGIVEKRLFAEGSDVKEGATLFQIEPRTYAAALNAAKADVEAARLVVARYKPLVEIKAVSQQEVDAAEARYKQAQATLARAALDMENTRVPAPISGRIGRTLVTEGALVGRGEATALATIEQIDPIYVTFTQPGSELLRLQAAVKSGTLKRTASTKVELLLEDGSLYPLPGKILFSDLAVNPSTGAVSVRAQFSNPDRTLLPGMFARVRFPSAVADNVIRVPQRAVQSGPQGQYVLLLTSDGKAVPQPVKTGSMAEGDFIISEGLKGGEKIILNGFQKLRPGAPFKAIPWQAPGTAKLTPSEMPSGKKAG